MSARKTRKAPAKAASPVETVVKAGEDVVAAAAEVGSEGYERVVAMTEEQVEKAKAAVVEGYDDLKTVGADNLNAVLQAGNILSSGVEAVGAELAAYSQSSIKSSVAAAEAMLGCTSVTEAVKMQAAFVQDSYKEFMGEAGKVSAMAAKTANKAAVPLNACVNHAVKMMLKPLAA